MQRKKEVGKDVHTTHVELPTRSRTTSVEADALSSLCSFRRQRDRGGAVLAPSQHRKGEASDNVHTVRVKLPYGGREMRAVTDASLPSAPPLGGSAAPPWRRLALKLRDKPYATSEAAIRERRMSAAAGGGARRRPPLAAARHQQTRTPPPRRGPAAPSTPSPTPP